MMDGHGGGFADPIVLPFSVTVPDPRPRAHRGMSRLEPVVNHPANGWADERPEFEWSLHRIMGFTTEWLGTPAARAQDEVPGTTAAPAMPARSDAADIDDKATSHSNSHLTGPPVVLAQEFLLDPSFIERFDLLTKPPEGFFRYMERVPGQSGKEAARDTPS